MDQRCLINGVTNGILSDIIKNVLTNNNIRVYETSTTPDQLINQVSSKVDCIFMGKNNKGLPEEYRSIFDSNNNLIIVEILNDGKSMGLYIDDISTSMLEKIVTINKK